MINVHKKIKFLPRNFRNVGKDSEFLVKNRTDLGKNATNLGRNTFCSATYSKGTGLRLIAK